MPFVVLTSFNFFPQKNPFRSTDKSLDQRWIPRSEVWKDWRFLSISASIEVFITVHDNWDGKTQMLGIKESGKKRDGRGEWGGPRGEIVFEEGDGRLSTCHRLVPFCPTASFLFAFFGEGELMTRAVGQTIEIFRCCRVFNLWMSPVSIAKRV